VNSQPLTKGASSNTIRNVPGCQYIIKLPLFAKLVLKRLLLWKSNYPIGVWQRELLFYTNLGQLVIMMVHGKSKRRLDFNKKFRQSGFLMFFDRIFPKRFRIYKLYLTCNF